MEDCLIFHIILSSQQLLLFLKTAKYIFLYLSQKFSQSFIYSKTAHPSIKRQL